MKRNPYIHALLAGLYIVLVVLFMSTFVDTKIEETLLAPMVMLSLLVLSVAIMGYLFFFEPARMYLEGAKQEALVFFGKTVATLAVIAVVFLLIAFSV